MRIKDLSPEELKEHKRSIARAYYARNREKILQNQKDKKHKDPLRWAQQLEYYKKLYHEGPNKKSRERWREENYERTLLNSCRRTARILNIDFNLELSDIVIPEVCPILLEPITRIQGKGSVPTNGSIDRVIPELGYTKGNIRVISNRANRMKSDATKDQLLTFANNISSYINRSN